MFIGRERELASLNKLYASGKFEFAVLYGRRRVGKTALINHFIDGKPAIYFMGVESNAKQNLENFSKSILEYAGGVEADASFTSFQAALDAVFRLETDSADFPVAYHGRQWCPVRKQHHVCGSPPQSRGSVRTPYL